jgi:HSP20 family protein
MASQFLTPFRGGSSIQRRGEYVNPLVMLQRDMDRLFSDVLRTIGTGDVEQGVSELVTAPRVEIQEKDDKILISAEIPGVNESDIDVSVEDDMLVLSGEKKREHEEDRGGYHVAERIYGRFRRAIQLPFAPDPERVDARFQNGVLTLTIPKEAQQRERTKRIAVKGAGAGGNGASGGNGGRTSTASAEEKGKEAAQTTA